MLAVEQDKRPSVDDLLNLPQISLRLREKRLKDQYQKMKKKEDEFLKKEHTIQEKELEFERKRKEFEDAQIAQKKQQDNLEQDRKAMEKMKTEMNNLLNSRLCYKCGGDVSPIRTKATP